MYRLVVILITMLWGVHQANAMDFRYDIMRTSVGEFVAIQMSGNILINDNEKFGHFLEINRQAINQLASNRSLSLIYSLDSGGGNVGAALAMAQMISKGEIPTAVVNDHECASACFLIFAASPQRYASAGVFIGVHSPSLNGNENTGTMALNVFMARSLQGFGIPSSILGEMIITPPDGMYKLSQQDITSMGVQDIAVRETVPAPSSPLVFSFPGTPPPPSSTPNNDFQIGLAARTAFQEWLVGLQHHETNDIGYQEGALWWTGNRSVPNSGCQGKVAELPASDDSDFLKRDNFLKGCQAAKVWLDPTDTRRKTSPEYRKGWNSYGEPQVATVPQVPALPPSEPTFTPMIEEPKQAMICGKRTSFNPSDLVWLGTWNNPGKLCGAVIFNRTTLDMVYIYGGSLPWKQQHVRAQTSGTPITSFSFVDDDGSTFRFSESGGGNNTLTSLRAEFHGRTGADLTGSFLRYQ
jgi:hypothetical protein